MKKIFELRPFLSKISCLMPWLVGSVIIIFLLGLYLALVGSPPDYQQGEAVRIMYIHVPSAWMSMMVYTVLAIFCVVYLVWKHPVAALAAKALAPIGLVFTASALVSGAIWGKPMWGAWWVWDARLTSVLVMFFVYLGYVALWSALGSGMRAAKATSILALIGVINIPIIKFSVDWWTTLHQPASVFRFGGPTIDCSMLLPLFMMAGAYGLYTVMVFLARLDAELMTTRLGKLARERAKRELLR